MKPALLLCLLLLTSLNLVAQYPKLIVQFRDKNNNSYSFSDPVSFLSQRAVDRRVRYHIATDSTDLPVSNAYLDAVRLAGNVRILSTSKWLNQVLIETTDESAVNKIRALAFVVSAKGVGLRVGNNGNPDKFKNSEVSKISEGKNRETGSATDSYDYGSNYSQVHIHEGEFLHNKGYRGETMQIAVLDAGFSQYKTITAFDSIRLNGQVKGEKDFVAFDNSVNEDNSHGMYCLSTMSANWPGRMVGTAPKASYWLIRTENSASEYPIEEHNWAAGAEFADSAGSDMISSSLGYYNFDDASFNHTYADFYKNSAVVTKAAAMAVRKGMIVMNSAGNEGSNSWKYLIFPADADSVCSVGAVTASGAIAGFSSYGYPGKVKPNIVSVGQSTVVAGLNNQPATGNGTSFSNPNIAGLIGCLWQAFPAVNNMKILDAVYKSADRYSNPDNRFGYGIPNFRKAYQILKHDENGAAYGSSWLFATPGPFTNKIDAKFIAQIDGSAVLELLDAAGKVIASKSFTTEKEELYSYTFTNLGGLSQGNYTVRYTDSATNKLVVLQKVPEKDWISAVPNPFNNNLTVSLKALETGEISLQLTDAKGSVVDKITLQTILNESYTVHFNNVLKLQKGAYFLCYLGKNQKRTIKLIKD